MPRQPPLPAATHEALSSQSRWPLAVLVFLFPAAALVVDSVASVVYGLLALSALVLAGGREEHRWRLSRHDRLILFAAVFFVVVAGLSYVAGEPDYQGWKRLARHARLLLVIPVFLVARRLAGGDRSWRWGLATGAVLAGAYALGARTGIWSGGAESGPRTVAGVIQPSLFGGIAMIMGAMAAAGAGSFRGMGRFWYLIPAAALVGGLTALVLSGSRGIWPVVITSVVILGLMGVRRLRDWQRLALMISVVAALVLAYLVPATQVAQSFHGLAGELEVYVFGDEAVGALGLRQQMMHASLSMFREHPFLGAGIGDYPGAVAAMVARGEVTEALTHYSHPHNEYLLQLATRGSLGLLSLLLLFALPLMHAIWGAGHPDEQMRRLAYAMAVLVVGYATLGLADSLFHRALPITFFGGSLALCYGLMRAREQAWLCSGHRRTETLSVALITRDEADRIRPCLDAVCGWADEIVVLDSGSTDDTVAIARTYTDKVYETDWPGYGPQKQRAAERCTSDWILSLDADERLTPELRAEIDGELAQASRFDAFRFPWSVEIFGDRVDFGADGRYHLRLFRRKGPAQFNDAVVHEGVVPAGRRRTLHGPVLHVTFRDFRHLKEKFARYAALQSEARFRRGRRSTVLGAVLRSLASFLLLYGYRCGFLDGRRGLLMAMLYAQYTFDKYAALWALEVEAAKTEADAAGEGQAGRAGEDRWP